MRIPLRRAVVIVVSAIASVWAVIAIRWRRSRAGAGQRYHALDELRRRYVFGSLDRQEFEEGVRKAGRHRRRREAPRSEGDTAAGR